MKGRRASAAMLNDRKADLDAGEVVEEQGVVDAVKVFREPEHGMKIYFLHLSDGRVRVRYDHDSADVDGDGKSRRSTFPLSREVRMIHYPVSGEVDYRFSGETIRKPRAQSLDLHPDKWPEDETWCNIPWEDLDAVMARQKPLPGEA